MLSILIPTYNHNVLPLVTAVHSQLEMVDVTYEIIVYDDGSTIALPDNETIVSFKNTQLLKVPTNIGRSAIRHALAESAKYQNLLFLDADVMPVTSSFIASYLDTLQQQEYDVIYGGVAYAKEHPTIEERLRWEYGRQREVQPVSIRQKKPHFIITQNVLITKTLFLSLTIPKENFYGDDLVFSQQLKRKNATVIHINNPVFHLGLEPSGQYLQKALSAVKSIVTLEKEGILDHNLTALQQSYVTLKKFGAVAIFKWYITPKKEKMKQNLMSGSPKLRWFDLYRLLYYIELKSEAHA